MRGWPKRWLGLCLAARFGGEAARGVEQSACVGRARGVGGCIGRRRSSAERELRWPVVMEARPYSVGAEEGR
jgi:hypothetical protein